MAQSQGSNQDTSWPNHQPAMTVSPELITDVSIVGEEAWIEVIQKMDTVYAELVDSQTLIESKNAELESAQKFISSVLSSMTDALIVCDTNGKIQQVNTALEFLTGYQEQTLIGRPLEYIFGHSQEELLAQFPGLSGVDEPVSDQELSVLNICRIEIPLSINCSPRYDHKGKIVGVVLIGRPVGELRHAYERLDEAHRTLRETQQQLVSSVKMAALGRLVAGVAHELNNPISFVFGNMHALKTYGDKITKYLSAVERLTDNDELKSLRDDLNIKRIVDDLNPLVEGTLEGAERVSDIVQELRRFSGNQKKAADEFPLLPLVESAVNWVLRGAKRKPKVEIICTSDIRLTARKGYLHQVMINLIQNGLDAMNEVSDPKIAINCSMDDGQVQIEISDSGTGISNEDMEQIFEPFFTTKPIGQGTGLGLYVSYNMVEELGGDLSAKNNQTGGAMFVLHLPINGALEVANPGDEGLND